MAEPESKSEEMRDKSAPIFGIRPERLSGFELAAAVDQALKFANLKDDSERAVVIALFDRLLGLLAVGYFSPSMMRYLSDMPAYKNLSLILSGLNEYNKFRRENEL